MKSPKRTLQIICCTLTWQWVGSNLPPLSGSQAAEYLRTPASELSSRLKQDDNWPDGTGGQTGTASGAGMGPCSVTDDRFDPTALTALVVPAISPNASDAMLQPVITQNTSRLWFNVPYSLEAIAQDQAKLEIYNVTNQLLHEQTITLTATGGIISVAIPTEQLETGQWYQMSLSIEVYCTPTARPAIDRVTTWVQHQNLDARSIPIDAATSPEERVMLYEQQGLWYDALSVAAELKQSNPSDQSWMRLLQAVQLEAIANSPMLECCVAD